MAYFPKYSTFFNLQKTPTFLDIWTKLRMSKWWELSVFGTFLSILRLAWMFYIIYIKKENLLLEQKWVNEGKFSLGG